ncbi:uncharacterized protein LOC109139082 isoform X2 [Larimichthys crocea]|nr:uncharacterized protein LOC109139082 isoform X2 [Larimichthys crocea]
MPHQEHCPLDSYSRCKKLGIDFNVGSGMKQNLDPELLTNGVMVELNTFATALLSAQKHFITDILEHNFDLNFENELSRSAFADEVMRKIKIVRLHKSNLCTRQNLVKRPFELPDVRCIEEPSHAKTLHCPKCYQDQKFHEDESDSGHMHHLCPHTMSDTVSADVKCTTQKHAKDASSAFSATEETIMDSNPHCKKIGLNLCVDKDLPKDKLDMHVLTNSVMKEVVQFARRLCGTNNVVINDVLEHNFNIGKQSLDLNPAGLFSSKRKQNEPAWFNEVFVIQSYSVKPPGYIGKAKRESALHRSERMEVIRKRQLALQTKQERANMPSGSGENPYPACTVIGLNLDVASNSREKVILELELLTRAVVFEIHKFATLEAVNYYPRTVFDILDYNFDLSSQHYRRWEFSIATASKIQTMVNEYCKKDDNTEGADKVFKLPFMFDPETSQRVEKRQNIKSTNSSMDTATESNSSCVDIHTHFLTSANMLSSLPSVNSNVTSKIGNQPDERGFDGDGELTQTPRNAPNEWNMEQEEIRTGNYYTCPLGELDLESDEVSDSENTGKQDHLRNPESFSPSCPDNPNLDTCSAGSSQAAVIDQNVDSFVDTERQNDLDLKMWKLRDNHIQRILSMPHKEHCPLDSYSRCKKLGIDFNVGSGMKQNLDPNLLTNGIMFELNTFATTLLSAQKYFITEILEHNFDLNFENELSRSAFTDKVMRKIYVQGVHRKNLISRPSLLKKPFHLPDVPCIEEPSHVKTLHCPKCYQDQKFHEDESDLGQMHHPRPYSMSDTVSAEVKCTTQKHAKDVSSTFSTTEETIMDSYRRCKQIGLNLCVDKDLPKVKLDMHVLSIGTMIEVVRFAKKLCGTNFQVINDVLEHNFNIGKQSLDLNPAGLFYRERNPNDGGPAWLNKVFVIQSYSNRPPGYMGKVKWESALPTGERMENIKKRQLVLQTKQERDSNHKSGDEEEIQTVRNSPNKSDTEQEEMGTEHNMWKLRSNRVEQILSALTKDFGRFSKSKRVGLEYNVGFGPKQNISVKSLQDSLLFEIGTFALAMNSSQKDFIMEILEYNFDVNLSSQHHRNIFASDIMNRVRQLRSCEVAVEFSNEVFKLPGLVASINMTGQSEGCVNPELGMSNMGKCDVAPVCPLDSHAETKEHISCRGEHLYPLCKEIGLNLHVNNSQPNKKMEINKLTNGAMAEVTNFAEKLCGTFEQICLDILRHNLDFDLQRDSELAKNILARIKTRKLALHSSQSPCQSVMKSKSNYSICFPLCSKIGLDLDVTSKSEEKEKLDLELLTTAVVAEIHKYISKKLRHYYPGTLFDILDYNFDLSSQHYRRWEFSLATAFEVQSMVKLYRKNKAGADEIFKLPFVFAPQKRKRTKCSMGEPEKKRTEGSCVHQVGHHSDVNHVSLLSGVQTKEETCSHDEDTKSLIDQWTMNIQNPGLVSVGCGSSLQVDVQIKKEEYDPHYADIKPEEVTGEKCHPQHVDVKTESVTGGVEHLVPYESPGSLGNTVNQNHLENTTSTDIPGQSESRLPVGCATFPTPTNVSSTLPNTNVNSPFTRGTDERELLKSSVDHWIMNVQNPGLVNTGCGSPLQENIQIKKEDYDPHYDKPEPDTEEKYHPQHVDVKAESNICDVEHLIPCEPAGSHGYAIITTHANSESNINTESENECFTESHIQIELDTPGINVIIIDESYENAFI